jgi:hypothetical protein
MAIHISGAEESTSETASSFDDGDDGSLAHGVDLRPVVDHLTLARRWHAIETVAAQSQLGARFL